MPQKKKKIVEINYATYPLGKLVFNTEDLELPPQTTVTATVRLRQN